MKKQIRKLVSLLLATVMVITMLPLTAFAETVSETDVSLSDVSVVETSEADTVVEDVETVNSIEEINEEEPEEDSTPIETESINTIDDSVVEDTEKENNLDENVYTDEITDTDLDTAESDFDNNSISVDEEIVFTVEPEMQKLTANLSQREAIVAVAQNEYKLYGGTTCSSRPYHVGAWCARFVTWCARQAGIDSNIIGSGTYANPYGKDYISRSGNKNPGLDVPFKPVADVVAGKYTPRPGDLVFFDWINSENPEGDFDHVGIVVSVSGGKITTVEGNKGDPGKLGTRTEAFNYKFNGGKIIGYGVPNYSGESSYSTDTSYPIAGGVYRLKNIATGKYLTVSGNSDSNSTNILVDSNKNASGQRFLVYNYYGNYAMRPECTTSEKVVNVSTSTSATNGNNVMLYSRTNNASQLWTLEQAKGDNYGLFYIKSTSNTNVTLNVDGTNVNVATYSGGNTQLWSFEPVDVVDLGDSFYGRIVNYGSKNPIVSRDGNVVLSESRLGNESIWKFSKSDDGTYLITDADGKAMDIASAKNEIRTNIQVWTANNNSAQRWMIKKTKNGYTLQAKMSDFIMDVDQGYSADGTNIRTYSANGTEAQTWIIEKGKFECVPVKTCYYNGSVYSLYEESMMWWDAKDVCEAIGGHLATITSQEEQAAVASMLGDNNSYAYWLGGTDADKEGVWKWITGEAFSFSNWYGGNPDNYDGIENYLEIYDKKDAGWNDKPGIYEGNIGFVCEIETNDIRPKASITYDGKKYELYETSLTWNDAQTFAESKGGYLAAIEDADENKAVSDLAAANGSQYRYWLGGTDYGRTDYGWVTGEPFSYSNWAKNEPSHTYDREFYIQMYNNESGFTNGTWNDYRQLGYTDKGNGFVIEYPNDGYVVTYDANGGSGAPDNQTKELGKSIILSSKKPTYGGYSFIGWNTKADGSGTSYAPGASYNIDESIILYAQWQYNGSGERCGDNLEWSFNDGLLKITGTGAMYDYDSCAATPWYSVMSDIEEVQFGDGITHIGAYAFNGAENIAKITIPSSITSVGEQAFYTSRSRDDRSVYFTDLSSWCSMIIPDYSATPAYYCKYAYLNGELIEELVIPDDVTEIKDYTLSYLEGVKKVTIPNNVKSIGKGAFFNSYAITDITFSEGLTHIGTGAFVWCCGLKSICIPDSVIDIEEGAFQNCYALESVALSKNLDNIPTKCFSGDTELKAIYVPKKIAMIGENAFSDCGNFTMYGYADSYAETYASQYDNITFVDVETTLPFTATPDSVSPGGTIELTAQGGEEYRFYGGYNGNWSEYLQDFSSDNTCSFENTDSTGEYKFYCDIEVDDGFVITREVSCNVTLPTSGKCGDNLTWSYSYDNNTLSITGTGMMYDYGYTDDTMSPWSKLCDEIDNISFGKGITHIGSYAFFGCNMTEIDIPEGVTSIGNNAFETCVRVTSVRFPKGIRSIGAYAFEDRGSDVYITDMTEWCNIDFEDVYSNPLYPNANLYLNNELVEELHIPEGVTRIADNSFAGCMSLKTVILPESVTEIGSGAFEACGATEVTLSNKLTRIGDDAFCGCPIEMIDIPDSVIYIDEFAFAGCRALKEIRIPDSVTEIGADAFVGCSNLEHVVLSKNMQIIPAECFAAASELKTVFVPESITEIDELAFEECGDFTMYGYAGSYAETYAALYDNITFIDVNTAMPFMASPADSSEIGSTVTLSAMGGEKYKFYYECSGSWVRLSDFNSGNTYEWKPSKVGKYNLYCDIKTADGAVICKIMPYEVKEVSVNFTAAPESETKEGTSVTLSASGGISYKFYYYFEGVWVTLKDYGKANTYEWTPTEAGEYTLYADIMSSDGDIISRSIQYTVVEGTSFKVTPTTTIQAGNEVTLSASGGISYKFYYCLGNSWVRIRDFEKSGTCKWTPTKAGSYTLYCDIMDPNGDTVCKTIDYTVTEPEKFTANLKFAYASPQKAGTTIKLTASATGGKGALKYKFYSECNGVWTKLWDYDTRDTYNWHATTVGTHTVYCDVMDEEGNVACAVVKYEIVKGESFVADLNANRISGQLVGTEIRLLGGSSNGTGTVKYKFYYEIDGNWVRLCDFSTQDYFLWTPTKAGYYNLYMDAQDEVGNTASKRLCITIDEGQSLKVTDLTADPENITVGTETTLTGVTTGGSGTITYKFYYECGGSWVKIQDFSEKNTCKWKPTKAGTYHIYLDAIDGTKNTQCLMKTYIVK